MSPSVGLGSRLLPSRFHSSKPFPTLSVAIEFGEPAIEGATGARSSLRAWLARRPTTTGGASISGHERIESAAQRPGPLRDIRIEPLAHLMEHDFARQDLCPKLSLAEPPFVRGRMRRATIASISGRSAASGSACSIAADRKDRQILTPTATIGGLASNEGRPNPQHPFGKRPRVSPSSSTETRRAGRRAAQHTYSRQAPGREPSRPNPSGIHRRSICRRSRLLDLP